MLIDSSAPKDVRLAVVLLWAVVLLSLFGTIYDFPNMVKEDPELPQLFWVAIFSTTFIIATVITYAIGRGKRWAVWTNIILFALSALFGLPEVVADFEVRPIFSSYEIGQYLLSAVSIHYLRTKRARAWFNRTEV